MGLTCELPMTVPRTLAEFAGIGGSLTVEAEDMERTAVLALPLGGERL